MQEADYCREMGAFVKVLADAKEVSKVEATAEEYNNATKALQDAYKALTAAGERRRFFLRRQKIQNTEKRNKSRGNEGKQRNKSKGENNRRNADWQKEHSVNGNLAQKDAAPVIQNSRTLFPCDSLQNLWAVRLH